MTEKLFQFIWQFRYFNQQHLTTLQEDSLKIIYPGSFNTNQGPDFLDGRILLGKQLWAGNIELHLQTSDWYKHKHQQDHNYCNVILHVVWQNDLELDKLHLPTLELQPRISNLLLNKYRDMMDNSFFVPCENSLRQVSPLVWTSWIDRLLVERLHRKSEYILQLLKENKYSWEDTLWWMLARSFGLKVNEEVFEEIARSLPVRLLARHRQMHQIEALLLGQAGLLHPDFEEAYPVMLWKEYKFLSGKYDLQPVNSKPSFLRMRPFNFPTIRLAQLAMLICHSQHLFSTFREIKTVEEIRYLLNITANDYWHYHYCLDEKADYKPKTLGTKMIENIIINTIVPLLYTYGTYHKDQNMIDKVLKWLEDLPGEKNAIIKAWHNVGIPTKYAYESQALLELKKQYCNNKQCLNCAVGNAILKGSL